MRVEQKTHTAQEENAPEPRLFDIAAAVAYLQTIGATGATVNFVRGLITTGQVPHVKIGKKFCVSRNSLDAWLCSHEKRRR